MAFGEKKIFPLDRKPGTAIGVGIPFNAPGVFTSTYLTKDAIKVNIINFFLTNHNERYLNPTFGGNLRAFIFEQITQGNEDFLKEDIQSQLVLFFPDLIIINLEINSNADRNTVSLNLAYEIQNTGIKDEIQIIFN